VLCQKSLDSSCQLSHVAVVAEHLALKHLALGRMFLRFESHRRKIFIFQN